MFFKIVFLNYTFLIYPELSRISKKGTDVIRNEKEEIMTAENSKYFWIGGNKVRMVQILANFGWKSVNVGSLEVQMCSMLCSTCSHVSVWKHVPKSYGNLVIVQLKQALSFQFFKMAIFQILSPIGHLKW